MLFFSHFFSGNKTHPVNGHGKNGPIDLTSDHKETRNDGHKSVVIDIFGSIVFFFPEKIIDY